MSKPINQSDEHCKSSSHLYSADLRVNFTGEKRADLLAVIEGLGELASECKFQVRRNTQNIDTIVGE